jgi:hypothetical protein
MKSSTMAIGLCLGMATASAFSPAVGVLAMTPDEFAAVYPVLLDWIQQTIAKHEHSGKIVAAEGFRHLPLYFSQELLNTTTVVTISRVPIPHTGRPASAAQTAPIEVDPGFGTG